MVIKHTNIFHCKALQNYTQIGIFCLKINHLATPVHRWASEQVRLELQVSKCCRHAHLVSGEVTDPHPTQATLKCMMLQTATLDGFGG
jgi:hypothetical protein